jgi:hypothetical protein
MLDKEYEIESSLQFGLVEASGKWAPHQWREVKEILSDKVNFIKSIVTKSDAQTILEELKLRGVGNGIIRKMVECFKSIGSISKTLFKNSPYVINGLMDMLGYTGLLIPTMNAISALIGKYDLNMDTLPGNFMALGLGVTTFLAKNGFDYLFKKLKGKFGLKTSNLNLPTAVKPYEIVDGEIDPQEIGKNKLIKEQ